MTPISESSSTHAARVGGRPIAECRHGASGFERICDLAAFGSSGSVGQESTRRELNIAIQDYCDEVVPRVAASIVDERCDRGVVSEGILQANNALERYVMAVGRSPGQRRGGGPRSGLGDNFHSSLSSWCSRGCLVRGCGARPTSDGNQSNSRMAFFIPPRFSFELNQISDIVGLVVFLVVCLAIAGFSGTMREAQRRAVNANIGSRASGTTKDYTREHRDAVISTTRTATSPT